MAPFLLFILVILVIATIVLLTKYRKSTFESLTLTSREQYLDYSGLNQYLTKINDVISTYNANNIPTPIVNFNSDTIPSNSINSYISLFPSDMSPFYIYKQIRQTSSGDSITIDTQIPIPKEYIVNLFTYPNTTVNDISYNITDVFLYDFSNGVYMSNDDWNIYETKYVKPISNISSINSSETNTLKQFVQQNNLGNYFTSGTENYYIYKRTVLTPSGEISSNNNISIPTGYTFFPITYQSNSNDFITDFFLINYSKNIIFNTNTINNIASNIYGNNFVNLIQINSSNIMTIDQWEQTNNYKLFTKKIDFPKINQIVTKYINDVQSQINDLSGTLPYQLNIGYVTTGITTPIPPLNGKNDANCYDINSYFNKYFPINSYSESNIIPEQPTLLTIEGTLENNPPIINLNFTFPPMQAGILGPIGIRGEIGPRGETGATGPPGPLGYWS